MICIIPVALTIVLVLLALFVTTIYFPKLEQYVQIICMIPYTIQGVILSSVSWDFTSSNPTFWKPDRDADRRLLYYHTSLYLSGHPQRYAFRQYADALRGRRRCWRVKLYAFFKVIVPNILSAIVVSSLLAIGIIFGDYVLVRNLAGSVFPNVQIYLYQAMKSDSMKSSAVFCCDYGRYLPDQCGCTLLQEQGRTAPQ